MIITERRNISADARRTLDNLPDPCLVVTLSGEIALANRAAKIFWPDDALEQLNEIDPLGGLADHIAAASRSTSSIMSRAVLGIKAGAGGTIRCSGNLFRSDFYGDEALVLLRFMPERKTNFGALTAKVRELASENDARRKIQAELEASLEERDLLLRELKHRVKNLFAVVTAMVTLSMREEGDFETKARLLNDRIRALSLAHDVGSGDYEKGQDLAALVRLVIAPFDAAEGTRIEMIGPELCVPADLISTLGLALHEWGVNALKHGALSNTTGRVDIMWDVEVRDDSDYIVLDWRESGGPPIEIPPEKRGFGSQLVDRIVSGRSGAHMSIEWPPEGKRIRLELPLPAADSETKEVCRAA